MFYYSPYLIPTFFSSLVTGVLGFQLFGRRKARGAFAVLVMMCLLSTWSCAYGLQTAATELWLKVLFYKIGCLCGQTIGPVFLSIALGASGYGGLTRRSIPLLSLPPFLVVLSVWTMQYHSLDRYDLYVARSGPLLVMGFKAGPLHAFDSLYAVGLTILSLIVLIVGFARGTRARRLRCFFLFIGSLAPLTVQVLDISPWKGFGATTSTLWFTGICYTLAIFRYRLLGVLPAARSALFEELSEPVLVFDGSGMLVDANRAAGEMLAAGSGKEAPDLLEAARARFPMLEALGARPTARLREVLPDAALRERYWQVSTTPFERNDSCLGTIVHFSDVSDLIRAEEAMRAAREAAEEASRVKSDFLAMVSHELRTPLQAIIGFGDLALERNDPERFPEYLAMIGDASRSLLEIVTNILDLSRIEAGRIEFELSRFDLRKHVEHLAALHAHRAERKGLVFSLAFADDVPPWVTGDPFRVGQILSNIVGNAVKFTHAGRVEVFVAASARGEEAPEGTIPVRFTVRDTGAGIPEEKKGLIFESFTQVDPGVTRRYGGSGLGTAIAKRLAKMMGGDITFESRGGEGSIFLIDLPFAAAERGAPVPRDPEPRLPAAFPLSILVVEDNLFNQRLLADTLGFWGHCASLAPDGREAVAKWQEGRFDIVLMDLMMPVMDGYEATRRIRAAEAAQGRVRTPVVALTADCEASVRKKCLDAGMDDILAKPVRLSAIEELLGRCSAPSGASGRGDFPASVSAPIPAPAVGDLFDPVKLGAVVDDPGRLALYCTLLAKDLEREMGRLAEAVNAGERNAVSSVAHAIKGAVIPLRGARMSALAAEVQSSAEAGDDERMAESFARLRDAGEELCKILKKASAAP